MKNRCPWCLQDQLYRDYHDQEWGVPVHDHRQLFEMLILEGFQAGLSWYTILKKRSNFQAAFDGFVPEKIVRWDEAKIQTLLQDKGIVRNQQKIRATVKNAEAYLRLQEEGERFSPFLWSFVGGAPLVNWPQSMSEVPATTLESDRMSKALKQRGFTYVGSTICYAFMQATGMVDDHLVSCWRKPSTESTL
jgi:DNA-3-methyladenine glycosylase I